MQLLKTLNLALAFLLELGMLAIFGYWAFLQGKNPVMKYLLAFALPLTAAVLWGIFAAPKSQYRLDFMYRIIFELGMFLVAAFLLYRTEHTVLSLCFAVLAVFCLTVVYIYKQ